MQEHFLKNMDNKSYNKQREIASLSYPPRSLNNAGTSKNLDFKPFFEVASAF